jgi:hypothetical protein
MEQRTNYSQTRRNEQVEERSLGSLFVNAAVTGAGGAVGVGAVAKGSGAVGKLVDKVKPKEKN